MAERVHQVRRRWMMFVDGEYLAIEGQKVVADNGVALFTGPWWIQNVFLWIPGYDPRRSFGARADDNPLWVQPRGARCTYYSSGTGSEEDISKWRQTIHEAHFHPVLIKKPKAQGKAKGVDISLAIDMLMHAFYDNYDVAMLVTGDSDFVPVVQQVSRLGKMVYLMHLGPKYGAHKDLLLSADGAWDFSEFLVQRWRAAARAPVTKRRSQRKTARRKKTRPLARPRSGRR